MTTGSSIRAFPDSVAGFASLHVPPPSYRVSPPGSAVPGYSTRNLALTIGGRPWRLRVLSDLQQFADPDGHGERLGISSAQWSLFGQVWPAGLVLAHAMHRTTFNGERILELGCGIGLASLVLKQHDADVVASDMHPLAESFLAYNAALNALPAVHYRQLRWDVPLPTLGRFDVIIASDVLYERASAELVSEVIARHANDDAQVWVTDPGRGQSARFSRLMQAQDYDVESIRSPTDDDDSAPYRGAVLRYGRGGGRRPAI
jgi:predicted nicotinamide N-methyase